MKTLVIMMGLQASGKSTFYAEHLSESYVHINLDTLKTRRREQEAIEACLAEGKSYAIDNTNPERTDRARYIAPAKSAGYRIVGYFMQSRIRDCIARNATRSGKARVPDTAIAATSNKLELPSYREGFDELYFVKSEGGETIIEKWRDYDEI